MSIESIPTGVSKFIIEHIHSVEQLETLLLLHVDSKREWTAEQVAGELRTSVDAARARLGELRRVSIIEEISSTPPKFRYAESNTAMAPIIEGLIQEYEVRRVSVISLIYTKPATELRAFSDAFRINNKKKEGS